MNAQHVYWQRVTVAYSWSEFRILPMPMPRFTTPPEGPAEQEARFRELLARARAEGPVSASERRAALHKLADYLGASGGGWLTRKRRMEMHEVLAAAGELGIEATLATVAAAPRDEVMEEAAAVLERMASQEALLEDLARRFRVSDRASVRATIVRGLGSPARDQGYERRRQLVVAALEDLHGEVREAAIMALGAMQDPNCRAAIEVAYEREGEPSLKEALAEVMAELAAL